MAVSDECPATHRQPLPPSTDFHGPSWLSSKPKFSVRFLVSLISGQTVVAKRLSFAFLWPVCVCSCVSPNGLLAQIRSHFVSAESVRLLITLRTRPSGSRVHVGRSSACSSKTFRQHRFKAHFKERFETQPASSLARNSPPGPKLRHRLHRPSI